MLGIEQAGIAETIDFILNHFHAELQTALVQVFAVLHFLQWLHVIRRHGSYSISTLKQLAITFV